jgi:N-hydroxyarylamine O-acetyltransferase
MTRLNYFQTRPKVASIEVNAYLAKLGLPRARHSEGYLKKLHREHLLRIPFENLDIHFKRPIVLDIQAIFKKIIPSHRGGFCYELNYLFYHLLNHLGFDCYVISAKVRNEETGLFGPEYDHMALVVQLDDKLLLVDVGFGDAFITPKLIQADVPQMDYSRFFKFSKDPNDIYELMVSTDGAAYKTLYQFTLKPHEPIEFLDMVHYHQTSPNSTFTQKKLITKLTPTGRITLTNNKLIIKDMAVVTEYPVLNAEDFFAKTEEHFGIKSRKLVTKKVKAPKDQF